ncbi:TetR/AcrR family transcriptional regulator [Shouchella shacheensis]|uniref:TetR/AcrR family transcriptional regulator n=1 Tax=Shouchella shacheensis TaxID=1649580 RepID=UPI00073FED36|nr:TetR/AcrR family transcriptional regulator [Shouchella shacheensis]
MSTRQKLLDAAYQIVAEDNILNLTLEKVAKRAAVSKGGLLYHFPSKEALLEGMVEGVTHSWDEFLHQDQEMSFTMRYFLSSYKAAESDRFAQMNTTMVAARTYQRELLAPIQEKFKQWMQELEADGNDPDTVVVLRLICDGLWFSDLFDLEPLTDEQKQRLTTFVQELTNKGS